MYVTIPGVFFFPGLTTVKKVQEINASWDFNALKNILLEQKLIEPISPEEALNILEEMPKKIEQFIDKRYNPAARMQQYRDKQVLRNHMVNKFWKPMRGWVHTAYKLKNKKIKIVC